MTLVAARDLSPLGIRVVTIAPGTINTPAYGKAADQLEQYWGPQVPFPKRMGRSTEYAAAGPEHHRERLPQRRDHPPRRSAAVPAEVTRSLAGKVAFVAGASRGIGATVAAALAAEGAAVAVAARSEQEGRMPGTIYSVADRYRRHRAAARSPCRAMSPTKSRSQAAVAATVAEFGGIDILVANAGVLWLGPIESTPLKRWQLCLDVNLTGVFLVTKAVIPHVRARGGGSLIAITTTGVGMMPGANAYWVSKAAVERLYLGPGRRPAARQHRRQLPQPVAGGAHRGLAGGRRGHGDSARDGRAAGGDGRRRSPPGTQDASGITGTIQRSEALTF